MRSAAAAPAIYSSLYTTTTSSPIPSIHKYFIYYIYSPVPSSDISGDRALV
jgi:hypothetical protein